MKIEDMTEEQKDRAIRGLAVCIIFLGLIQLVVIGLSIWM